MEVCIVRIILEKLISITSKQLMLLRILLTGKQDRFVLKFQGEAVNQS